ncbi:hypothetical protein GCM10027046_07700 [Uliginosibacterium flavum]|uniref:Solute-binding protein family 3/N-terminal domain-containing protein n=1 Tax=Uliginosibacterium flavum TaxID=1396831 RepID=A0ABV2TMS6_9RHOO
MPQTFSAKAKLTGLLFLLSALLGPQVAQADDVLIRNRPNVGVNQRLEFSDLVLEEAMRRTQKKYGPYRIEWTTGTIARERSLIELVSGETHNTTIVASQPSWEEQLLPIWIPVDMGLQNYRISLTTKAAQPRLSAVRALDELKALRAGIGAAWSSRKIMDANGFNLVIGENFEPILRMLLADRSDYFPRGVNEVFVEFDARSADNPELVVESDIVLEYPLPTYIFVSPKAPRLHQRLSEGMEVMVRDGTLRKMVMDYYADMIKRANFCARRLFRIENHLVSEKTPLQRKELWFDPYDPKTGMCAKPVTKPARKSAKK